MIENKQIYCILVILSTAICTSAQTIGTTCTCSIDATCMVLDATIEALKTAKTVLDEGRKQFLEAAAQYDKAAAEALAQGDSEAAVQLQQAANEARQAAAALLPAAITARAEAEAASAACKAAPCCNSCCNSLSTNLTDIFDPDKYPDPTANVMAVPKQCSI